MPKRNLTTFSIYLDYCIAAHRDSAGSLFEAIRIERHKERKRQLSHWRQGKARPHHRKSWSALQKIEQHYNLPEEIFSRLLAATKPRSLQIIQGANCSQQTALAWHLPEDFDRLSTGQQDEIIAWTNEHILPCTTAYGRYQRAATSAPFAIVFPTLSYIAGTQRPSGFQILNNAVVGKCGCYGAVAAPPTLAKEMEALISFRTASLAPKSLLRTTRWRKSTARYHLRQYGEIFGALAAAPHSRASGHGIALQRLTLALLVFPTVWDWYLRWRECRRGFLTMSEQTMMYEAKSATRDPTGWLRQSPRLVSKLRPIKGLLTKRQIQSAARDWDKTCDRVFTYASVRAIELHRTRRPHRDPLAAILPCLEAERPLLEYKKIGDEILRFLPEVESRVQFATTLRNYVMFRVALHLGLRQKNLRELLICHKGDRPRSLQQLEHLERGEMYWNSAVSKWVVQVPAAAFKNRNSTFFHGHHWEMEIPALEGIYDWIERYLVESRPALLSGAPDPGTLLVRLAGQAELRAEFDIYGIYMCWKRMIQMFGIYNPYTQRGAIKGLLPHGPHCARDVLATHVLKETNSFELAAYAIQDNPESVMRHYGRFLPKEKAAQAAQVLNKVWMH